MPIKIEDFNSGWLQPSWFSKVQRFLNGNPGTAFTVQEIRKDALVGVNYSGTDDELTCSLDDLVQRGHFASRELLAEGRSTKYYCSKQLTVGDMASSHTVGPGPGPQRLAGGRRGR